jgi:ubiquinone/menaquinone biosynthesis C-methylase UbiE
VVLETVMSGACSPQSWTLRTCRSSSATRSGARSWPRAIRIHEGRGPLTARLGRPAPRPLNHAEARAFYDRLGARQDAHGFYEDHAVERLIRYADFQHARAVVEFGCGTGRLAAELLQRVVPEDCTYVGFDVSGTMVALARRRLAGFGRRVRVIQTDGYPAIPLADASADRFLATYVFDLLSNADARMVVSEAQRVLANDGKLCLASLTAGRTTLARAVQSAWEFAYRIRPQIVGGCRPIQLTCLVDSDWQIAHREVVCRTGLCTEVLIAERVP